ncbi:MAG: ABC-2 type transport system permease protein [Candidatus Omnitrophota bacterium]|jgi:ABC-2 type transport system permease protein
MKKIQAILYKELSYYFKSPMAYIILFLTITTFNIFFYLIIDHNQEATLSDVFRLMEFLYIFIIPLLTMRSFAEENQHGTMEFLMTTPTSNMTIVLGKFFGVLCFYSVMIGITFFYYLLLRLFSPIGLVESLAGYCGLWLEGALFIAVGILISSLTRNQIIAALGTYLFIFFLYFSMSFDKFVDGRLEIALKYMSSLSHAENFTVGIVTLGDVVYYLSGIVLALILTRIMIEKRMWR